MIKLNMLPDIKREYIRTRRLESKVITGAVLTSIAGIGLVVLLALWVYGAQNLQKKLLTDQIKDNDAKLHEIKDIDKYVSIQNQLTQIDGLHAKKAIYSRIFDTLTSLNPAAPNNVRISKLTVDSTTMTLAFEGETESFTALETFRDTLKNADYSYLKQGEGSKTQTKLFSAVNVDKQAIGKNQAGKNVVTFSVMTTYIPELFDSTVREVAVVVPNKETTQSKVDAPDVFGEKSIKSEGNQ